MARWCCSANPKWWRKRRGVRAEHNLFFYNMIIIASELPDAPLTSLERTFARTASILQEIEGVAVREYRPFN